MNIEFEITNIPTSEQKDYLTAYLEGSLKISVDRVLFLNQHGILLLELAIVINKWLTDFTTGLNKDFIYESMDHDEPIFTIIYVRDGYYRIESIWQENLVTRPISMREVIAAFKKYLTELRQILRLKTNIKLDDLF